MAETFEYALMSGNAYRDVTAVTGGMAATADFEQRSEIA